MTYGDNRYDDGYDEYRERGYPDDDGYDDGYDGYAPERRAGRQWVVIRGLRALSGTVAAGIVILTLVVIGSAYLGGTRGFPGPGTTSLAAHIAASVIALAAQIWCDRRRGVIALVGSVLVLVTAAVLLTTQWWS